MALTLFTRASAITKSDDTIVGCKAIYVGGAGDVVLIPLADYDAAAPTANSVTIKAPPVGTILPIMTAKVMAATTATLLIALY